MEITVSDIAKDRLTELVGEHLQDGKAIRVFLGGGGCGCGAGAGCAGGACGFPCDAPCGGPSGGSRGSQLVVHRQFSRKTARRFGCRRRASAIRHAILKSA